MMNRLQCLTLALVAISCLQATAEEEPRYFKSKDGKTIKATLVAAVGDRVTIKRDSGKEFTVPVTSFSLEDQKFLRDWIKNNPNAIKYAFKIDAKAFKQKAGKKKEGYYDKLTTEPWAYEVSVTNQARNDVFGVTAKYRVILEDRVKPPSYESEYSSFSSVNKLVYKESEAKLPKMIYNGKTSFVTAGHELHKVRTKAYSSKNKDRDRMRGVWIKFYRKDMMIYEWKSGELPKGLEWDDKDLSNVDKIKKSSSSKSSSENE